MRRRGGAHRARQLTRASLKSSASLLGRGLVRQGLCLGRQQRARTGRGVGGVRGGAPDGQTSHVVVSSGRASSTAHANEPLSAALSGSSAASVHLGVTHSSALAPAQDVDVGKQRLKTSCVR